MFQMDVSQSEKFPAPRIWLVVRAFAVLPAELDCPVVWESQYEDAKAAGVVIAVAARPPRADGLGSSDETAPLA